MADDVSANEPWMYEGVTDPDGQPTNPGDEGMADPASQPTNPGMRVWWVNQQTLEYEGTVTKRVNPGNVWLSDEYSQPTSPGNIKRTWKSRILV